MAVTSSVALHKLQGL